MCGPACLLLSVLVWAVPPTSGVVTAPAALSVGVGQPLNLSCALAVSAGDTVHQVRWLDPQRHTVLAYEPHSPPRISFLDPNFQLLPHHRGTSHITIKAARPGDEGCFHCLFDVYPRGQQEGKTCVTVTGKVAHEGNRTAIAGRPTTLSCSYTLPEKVHQVLWRRTTEQGAGTNVASFSKYDHQGVDDTLASRVTLSTNVGDSRLTIRDVTMADEACYTCEFHTYPDGTRSAVACLSVDVLPRLQVTHVTLPSGAIEANCSAESKPSSWISWDVGGDNRTLGPPVLSSFQRSGGMTVVTSTVLLKAGGLGDVRCVVHHRGLDKPLSLPLAKAGSEMVVPLAVSGVVAVLLLCLCGCLCKCFVCSDG